MSETEKITAEPEEVKTEAAAKKEAETEKETEIEKETDKHLMNRMFILMLVIIGALIALFFFISDRNEKYTDLSHAFNIDYRFEDDTVAKTFAQDYVVSDPSVVIEGVTMSSTMEKALLFDIDSKTPLFAQGIYDKTYPASITKIMTAIVCMKYGNMDDVVVMTEEDFNLEEGSQRTGMIPGDTLTLRQLYNSLLIYSANDAALAIARHVGGSVDDFVALMNLEAASLGMTGTHFVNPHGLHDGEHYTTAYDVYIMLNEAIKYQDFTDTIRMNVYSLVITRADGNQILYRLDSTNKFMTGEKRVPDGAALWGGKTGTTPEAGSCLALVMQNRNGIPFIAVVLGADNSAAVYADMTALINCINNSFS